MLEEIIKAAVKSVAGSVLEDSGAFFQELQEQQAAQQTRISEEEQEIVFTVTGNGVLQHMVRIMVGTLLEVGVGERNRESIPDLFGAERSAAGPAVPACGLCLMEVVY